MKVYIAGPIAGLPNQNRNSFFEAENLLKWRGFEPVNPHNLNHEHFGLCFGDDIPREITNGSASVFDESHKYGCYMRADLRAVLECDGILLLPGWERSRGARVEAQVAEILGILFLDLEWLRTGYNSILVTEASGEVGDAPEETMSGDLSELSRIVEDRKD